MLFIPKSRQASGYAAVLLSGILLWLCWPANGFTPIIFVAWVPMLWAASMVKSPFGFFFSLLTAFLIWNTGTTWWIWNSTGPGAAGAIIANSLIMCFPLMAYRYTVKKLGIAAGLVAFVLYWLTYEYIHHNWELSWPWLTLGNAFATRPEWVNWYRFSGTSGGSMWVLVVNALLARPLLAPAHTPYPYRHAIAALGLLGGGIAAGFLLQPNIENSPGKTPYNVVVVQPNVEAYTEKFTTDPAVLAQSLIQLSESKIDPQTRLVVWPETALPAQAWEHKMMEMPLFRQVFDFLARHPQVQLVTGIDSYKLWGNQNPGGFSIRQMQHGSYYEAFNTAMGASKHGPLLLYHKSKLVPGVESLPSWLGFMAPVFDDFGGISGSLGRSETARVFSAPGNPYQPAPVICYESIYSDYVTDYMRKGANIITVITNDGWWGNTAGHHQHMHYARLRAIETGCWVARSANTGISCFIDPAGNIYQPQPWDTQGAIKMAVPLANHVTFYARYGDWISRGAWPLALILLAAAITARRLWKKT